MKLSDRELKILVDWFIYGVFSMHSEYCVYVMHHASLIEEVEGVDYTFNEVRALANKLRDERDNEEAEKAKQ